MEPNPPQIPRSSKSARPWNEYHVVLANQTYGLRSQLKSMKHVQEYENTLVKKGNLSPEDRISCDAPGCMKARKDEKHNHGEQGLLF